MLRPVEGSRQGGTQDASPSTVHIFNLPPSVYATDALLCPAVGQGLQHIVASGSNMLLDLESDGGDMGSPDSSCDVPCAVIVVVMDHLRTRRHDLSAEAPRAGTSK